MEENLKKSLDKMKSKCFLGLVVGLIIGCLAFVHIFMLEFEPDLTVAVNTTLFLFTLHPGFMEPVIEPAPVEIVENNLYGSLILYLCIFLIVFCKGVANRNNEFSLEKSSKNIFLDAVLFAFSFNLLTAVAIFSDTLTRIIEIKWATILLIILAIILYFRFKGRLKLKSTNKLFIFGFIFILIGHLAEIISIIIDDGDFSIGIILLFTFCLISILTGELLILYNLRKDIIIFKKQVKEGAIKEEKDFYLFKNIIYNLNLFIPAAILLIFAILEVVFVI